MHSQLNWKKSYCKCHRNRSHKRRQHPSAVTFCANVFVLDVANWCGPFSGLIIVACLLRNSFFCWFDGSIWWYIILSFDTILTIWWLIGWFIFIGGPVRGTVHFLFPMRGSMQRRKCNLSTAIPMQICRMIAGWYILQFKLASGNSRVPLSVGTPLS